MSIRTILEIDELIRQNHSGYTMLSTEYINNKHKLHIKCKHGHEFYMNYDHLRRGQWCSICSGNKKHTLDSIKEVIIKLHPNSQLLSSTYEDNKKKLDLICENNHSFSISFNRIQSGQWCAKCSLEKTAEKQRYPLGTVREIIHNMHPGAILLSNNYKNNKQKISLICENGHPFETIFHNINHGAWCPICAVDNRKRTTLERLGVEYAMQNKEVQSKSQETCLKNHGVRYPQQSKEIMDKSRKTCLENYGVERATQNIEIALKAARSGNNVYIKEHWFTKEQLICTASYEAKVVDYLNKNQINFKWQSELFILKASTYRPDFFLIDDNKWIEIKGYEREGSMKKWHEFHEMKPNSELWNKAKLTEMGIL